MTSRMQKSWPWKKTSVRCIVSPCRPANNGARGGIRRTCWASALHAQRDATPPACCERELVEQSGLARSRLDRPRVLLAVHNEVELRIPLAESPTARRRCERVSACRSTRRDSTTRQDVGADPSGSLANNAEIAEVRLNQERASSIARSASSSGPGRTQNGGRFAGGVPSNRPTEFAHRMSATCRLQSTRTGCRPQGARRSRGPCMLPVRTV